MLKYETLDPNITYLVTGAAGFIGYYLSHKLLEQGCRVIGIDNVNDYYDVNLKHTRLEQLKPYEKFTFIKADISDKDRLMDVFGEYKPNVVVRLPRLGYVIRLRIQMRIFKVISSVFIIY